MQETAAVLGEGPGTSGREAYFHESFFLFFLNLVCAIYFRKKKKRNIFKK